MGRTAGACQVPTLPGLAELPPAPPCERCGCCQADLCAAAVKQGTACLILAAPRADPTATAPLVKCPCAPVACRCSPPVHFRGIARCQHGNRARGRDADGRLLMGQSPAGGAFHPVVAGAAACSPALPIAAPVPIDQVPAGRRCQRAACRRRWRGEVRPPAAGDGVEHVCPACHVERAAGTAACPSCGSAYAAVPESVAL